MKTCAGWIEVNLTQLCIAYTLNNQLPREALEVVTRVKPLTSFLEKLEQQGWPDFYYPTDIIQDLIGARVVCWFVDDCYGIQKMLEQSHGFRVNPDETEDFIANPKPSGYRSIHLTGGLSPTTASPETTAATNSPPRSMVCEIQIRTRLQDAFGQLTHDFPYKFPTSRPAPIIGRWSPRWPNPSPNKTARHCQSAKSSARSTSTKNEKAFRPRVGSNPACRRDCQGSIPTVDGIAQPCGCVRVPEFRNPPPSDFGCRSSVSMGFRLTARAPPASRTLQYLDTVATLEGRAVDKLAADARLFALDREPDLLVR